MSDAFVDHELLFMRSVIPHTLSFQYNFIVLFFVGLNWFICDIQGLLATSTAWFRCVSYLVKQYCLWYSVFVNRQFLLLDRDFSEGSSCLRSQLVVRFFHIASALPTVVDRSGESSTNT